MLIDFKAFLHVQFPGCRVVLCFPGLQSMRELGESTLVVNHLKIPRKQKRDKRATKKHKFTVKDPKRHNRR